MKDLGAAGFSETCTQTAMQINMAGTSKTYVKSERLVEGQQGDNNLPHVPSKWFTGKSTHFQGYLIFFLYQWNQK